jgi:hypothetical protein
MKIKFKHYLFPFVFSLLYLFTACQSSKPGFTQTAPTTNSSTPNTNAGKPAEAVTTQPAKTVADPTQKLVYDSTKVNFKIKEKTKIETRVVPIDDDDEKPGNVTTTEITRITKHKKRESEKSEVLSGGFLISGLAVLLAALVLVIIGTGPAGLLAIIGGALFLTGFIFTMVELLTD